MNYQVMFLRLKQVIEVTTLSKSSIYKRMSNGDFPKQISIDPQQVVWGKKDIDDCMNKQIQSATL